MRRSTTRGSRPRPCSRCARRPRCSRSTSGPCRRRSSTGAATGVRATSASSGTRRIPGRPRSTGAATAPDGRELDGSASSLPSATGNPNTRDFDWRPETPYRLRIERAEAVGRPPGLAGERHRRGRRHRDRRPRPVGPRRRPRPAWSCGRRCSPPATRPARDVHWSDLRLTSQSGAHHGRVARGRELPERGRRGLHHHRRQGRRRAASSQITGTTRTTERAARLPMGSPPARGEPA